MPPIGLRRPPLALMVTDDSLTAAVIEGSLAPHGYVLLRALDMAHVRSWMSEVVPDVVIVDQALPFPGVVRTCRALREEGRLAASTPIVVVRPRHGDRATRMATLQAGAWDVLALPDEAEELVVKLETMLAAKFEADALREEALIDRETGVYGWQGLVRRAHEVASAAARHHRPLAAVAVSPENGAAVDEETARELPNRIASFLRASVRGSDSVGRFGDTDFAIIAPDTGAQGVELLAERLRQAAARAGRDGEALQLNLRAGWFGVDDFAGARIEPVEVLVRAASALRNGSVEGKGNGTSEASDQPA